MPAHIGAMAIIERVNAPRATPAPKRKAMNGLDTQILVPAAVLLVWTMAVMAWMMAGRMASFRVNKVSMGRLPRGFRASDAGDTLSGRREWPAHNYMHLMEQPTVFYPCVILLALGGYGAFDVVAAWVYVALRVAHSLWQNLVNTLPVRAALFMAGSIALFILTIRALLALIS